MIKAIFWDLGGVIVRTEDREPRTELATSLGKTYEEMSQLVFDSAPGLKAQAGKITTSQLWEEVCESLGLPKEKATRLEQGFFGGDRVDYELVAYIRSLRPRYHTGLISNALDDLRPVMESRWGIADAFDTLVISAEEGLMKPDARIFHLALERLRVSAQQAVFIDDFARNITGAQEVGMHAIHFRSPEQARLELEALLNHHADQRK